MLMVICLVFKFYKFLKSKLFKNWLTLPLNNADRVDKKYQICTICSVLVIDNLSVI